MLEIYYYYTPYGLKIRKPWQRQYEWYIGYTLSQAKKEWREKHHLKHKHIKFVELR
jgi:hypothetical protein